MKKFLFLMLSLAVAVSASAGITKSPMSKKIAKLDSRITNVVKVTRNNGMVPPSTPIQFKGWSNSASHVLRSDAAITWDFEDEAQFNEFQALDNDGDGFNWQYFNMTGVETGRMTPHGGEGLVASASYDNDSHTALTPDNWLISPEVTLGGSLSFYASGQDEDYCGEVFGVYVCIGTPNATTDFVQVGEDFTATGAYKEYEVDLSEYQGKVGHFAIVHHRITDMFWLNVDDITLDAGGVVVPYPVVPTVTVEPGTTTADVTWAADENADGYDLRWRPKVDMTGNAINTTLPLSSYQTELEDWYIYDSDGDGDAWGLSYSSSAQNDLCFVSLSVDEEGQGLTPDNWLISRDVLLRGEVRFTLWGIDSKPETLMVYAYVYGETEEEDQMYKLFENDLTTTATQTEYTVDLSDFEGALGFIIFRHYNSENQYALILDNIFIGDPNAEDVQPAEWNYVIDLTDPHYTIEGLTPETEYEVQVMGYNDAHESDWCDIVEFTTLAEAPAVPDVYMLGGDNQDWDCTNGKKFEYNAEDNLYTLNYTFPAETNYFGFTTRLAENNDDGGWTYIEPYRFGAVAEEGTNFIYYDDLYDGQPLDLTWDAYKAFQIGAGEYNITVDLTSMKVILVKVVPAHEYEVGDVNHDHDVNIADVTALIDYLLGSGSVCEICANVNGDEGINIADVTALIDKLLSKN